MVLVLYTYGLTANVIVGVIARAVVGVSVRVATRMDVKADVKVAARNKLIMLIVI
jgi:hypothetical protein